MSRFELELIAFKAIPYEKGDCTIKTMEKMAERARMVKRMIRFLTLIYS